jgi:hypothetical protein
MAIPAAAAFGALLSRAGAAAGRIFRGGRGKGGGAARTVAKRKRASPIVRVSVQIDEIIPAMDPVELRRSMVRATKQAAKEGRRTLEQATRRNVDPATGDMQDSWYTIPNLVDVPAGVRRRGVVHNSAVMNASDHAMAVEYGRKPGQRMPPVEARILPWVKKKKGGDIRQKVSSRVPRRGASTKGNPYDKQALREAWAVARHIAKHGVKAKRPMRKSLVTLRAMAQNTAERSMRYLLSRAGRRV